MAALPELQESDPLVAHAIHARDQIALLEEELLERLDELRTALASTKGNPERLRQSVEVFRELTNDMRQKSLLAIESVNAVDEKTEELSRSSRHLAGSYRALADLFRKKALDYTEKKLRDQLLAFAKDYDDMAAALPERCKTLDAAQRKLPALKRKLKEVHSFLNDAISFLHTHPGVGVDPRDRYAGAFESFAVTFSSWLVVLDARAKQDAETLWTSMAARLAETAADHRRKVVKWEADEEKYVAAMEADRQQVMTAALVADTKQMDAIARQESHLSRELARALAALEQVMRLRCDPADPLVFDLSRRRVTAEVRVGLPAIDAGVAG